MPGQSSVDLALTTDGTSADLEDLHEWLSHEPELRGRIDFVAHRPRGGELGTVTDALSIAVGGGGALTALATSLRAYFAQPKRADLRITAHFGDGQSVEIVAERARDIESLLLSILGPAD
jgi:hypothetical protein